VTNSHGWTPDTVCRIRTIVRLASSTLNAVPETVKGSRSAASAAARNVWLLADAPLSSSSASRARQAIVPTPPSARRAYAMVSSSISSAAAADVTANSYEARSRTFREPDCAPTASSGTSSCVISSPCSSTSSKAARARELGFEDVVDIGGTVTGEALNSLGLGGVIPLIVGGSVKPIVERVYPLGEASEALRHLTDDRPFGKVVLAG